MDGVQISVQNYSDLEWTRSYWTVGAGASSEVNWTDEVSKTPATVLHKTNGMTTAAAATVPISWLVEDALYMTLGYTSSEGTFAVSVQQMFHMFSIGKQDEWCYLDNNTWSPLTTDTTAHTWIFPTCKVVATPTLSNSGGSVEIVISKKK